MEPLLPVFVNLVIFCCDVFPSYKILFGEIYLQKIVKNSIKLIMMNKLVMVTLLIMINNVLTSSVHISRFPGLLSGTDFQDDLEEVISRILRYLIKNILIA